MSNTNTVPAAAAAGHDNPDGLPAEARKAAAGAIAPVARLDELTGPAPFAPIENLMETAGRLAGRFNQIDDHMRSGGYPAADWPPTGESRSSNLTASAGIDTFCGYGELITTDDGAWLHLYDPELRDPDDRYALPGGPGWDDDSQNEDEA